MSSPSLDSLPDIIQWRGEIESKFSEISDPANISQSSEQWLEQFTNKISSYFETVPPLVTEPLQPFGTFVQKHTSQKKP